LLTANGAGLDGHVRSQRISLAGKQPEPPWVLRKSCENPQGRLKMRLKQVPAAENCPLADQPAKPSELDRRQFHRSDLLSGKPARTMAKSI
jgi:hypothetical protein